MRSKRFVFEKSKRNFPIKAHIDGKVAVVIGEGGGAGTESGVAAPMGRSFITGVVIPEDGGFSACSGV